MGCQAVHELYPDQQPNLFDGLRPKNGKYKQFGSSMDEAESIK